MTAVTYTSVSAGGQVTLNLRCRAIDPRKHVDKTQNRARGGRAETLVWSEQIGRAVTTAGVQGSEREAIRDFLDAIEGGDAFQFDEFGSDGRPDSPVSMIMVGTYSEERVAPQGDGGRDDYFRFSFNIREA